MAELVLYETDGPLATVRLNRPEALNALTYPMLAAFRTAIEKAAADPGVLAIMITGAGRGFCAGLDMSTLTDTVAAGATPASGADPRASADPPALFSYLLAVPKPVIAAVNGAAAGGGFVLAMMCDLRFVSESAFFTTVFSKRGLIAEHGTSWLLPRLVGQSRALDLLWSSRKVGAEEAMTIGLADRIAAPDDLEASVASYVRELAASAAPRAIATMKRQVYDHMSAALRPAFEESTRLMNEALKHPDAREGAASFVERRPPRFAPVGGESP